MKKTSLPITAAHSLMGGCRKFVSELIRVTAPSGRVIIVTWCHRNLLAGESSLRPDEKSLLDRINEAYYLPPWCSLNDYKGLFGAFRLKPRTRCNACDTVSTSASYLGYIRLVTRKINHSYNEE